MVKPTRRKQLGKENAEPNDMLSNSLLENICGNNIDDVFGRRSEVGKISLCLVDADESINDVDINDDKKEKEDRRRRAEKERAERERTSISAKPNAFSILSNLSQEELDEHFSKCIEMCNRNKVNTKNAFKLQLIDYMKIIVSNQSTKSENLTLMSCTLGASAKIYAHRVDKVYTDMIKIVSGKGEIEKDDDSDAENPSDGENAKSKKRKTKEEDTSDDENEKPEKEELLNMEKMLLTEDQLNKARRNDVEPQERQSLPRKFDYFIECPQIDPDGRFSLNPPVFPGQVEWPTCPNTITINEPLYDGNYNRLNPSNYIHNYGDIRKCFFIMDEEGAPEESIEVMNSSLAFDPSSNIEVPDSIMIDAEERDLDNGDGVEPEMCGPDYDEDEDNFEPVMDSMRSGQVSLMQPKSFSAETMSRFLSVDHGDYSFFDNSRIEFLAGPRHWNLKRPKAGSASVKSSEQPNKKTAKKSCDLEISAERIARVKSYYFDPPSSLLSRKTIVNWSTRSWSIPEEVYSQRQLLSLMKNDQLLYLKKEDLKSKMICNSALKDKDETLLTPDDFGAGIDHDDDDDADVNFNDDDDEGIPPPLTGTLLSPSPFKDGELPDQPLDDSQCELIPAPQRVQRITIKYAKAQKRIDIKLLKSVIWENLDLEHQQPKEDDVKFSNVFSKLPEKLPSEEAEELSFPIAFMALLHMANEKTLSLKGNDSYSDISVCLG